MGHCISRGTMSRIGTYAVSKNNRQEISWRDTEYKLNAYYCYVNRYLQFSYAFSECV